MAKFSQALGALYATVASTANVISSAANTAATGVEELNRYVNRVRDDQSDRALVHRRDFRKRLIRDSAEANVKDRARIENWLAQNPDLVDEFNREVSELEALFVPKAA